MTTKDSPPEGNHQRGADDHEGAGSTTEVTPSFRECMCPEAVAFRDILDGNVPQPDTAGWRIFSWYADGIALRRIAAVAPMLMGIPGEWEHVLGNPYIDKHRITSVQPCALCGAQVEIIHPIEPWQYDMLPDLSWVRCETCPPATIGQSPTVNREKSLRGVPK